MCLAENSQGELLLIEVQGESEYAYFQRILFGAAAKMKSDGLTHELIAKYTGLSMEQISNL